MATVGYGDLVPVTVAGKMVGTGAIVCGVMVLALPITIMVGGPIHPSPFCLIFGFSCVHPFDVLFF